MRHALIQAREKKGYTHQQLADLVNIDRSYYTHIENGKRTPSFKVAAKIARTLEVKIEDIFLVSDVAEGNNKPKSEAYAG